MVYYANELYHHGIIGQKWGVRRFQNADGSYTNAGRQRYGIAVKNTTNKATNAIKKTASDVSNKIRNIDPETKKKILAGTVITAGALATGAYLYKHPDKALDLITKASSTSFDLRNNAPLKFSNLSHKAVEKGKEATKKALDDSIEEGKKIALKSVGAVAVKKIADTYKKYNDDPELNDDVKTALKVVSDDATNYVKQKTGAGRLNGQIDNRSNGAYNGKSASDIQRSVGKPESTQHMVDRNTREWGEFLRTVPENAKPTLKKMATDGYSYEQMRKVAKEWS